MIHEMNDMTSERNAIFWLSAALGIVTNGISVGFAAASAPGGGPLGLYAGSRSIALLAAAVGVALARSRPGVVTVVLASALFQGLDALIGLSLGDFAKTLGPAVLAAACAAAGSVLSRRRGDSRVKPS